MYNYFPKQKKYNEVMRILVIWLGILLCGAMNGCMFSEFGTPEKWVFILCVSLVCAALLLWHRKITKDWEAPKDIWTEGFHFPIFRITFFFSALLLIFFLIIPEATATAYVIAITIGVASFIAYIREQKYTDDWL